MAMNPEVLPGEEFAFAESEADEDRTIKLYALWFYDATVRYKAEKNGSVSLEKEDGYLYTMNGINGSTATGNKCYEFEDWYKDGVKIEADAVITPEQVRANMNRHEEGGKTTYEDTTFIAKFKPIEYKITYELGGGTVSWNPTSYTVESREFYILNYPKKEGAEFIGWTGTGLDRRTWIPVIPKGSPDDRVYTAVWYEKKTDSIEDAAVTLSDKSLIYNGEAQRPVINTIGGKALIEGKDYTVSYSQNGRDIDDPVTAGTYTLEIEGEGYYEGSTETSFTIAKASLTIIAYDEIGSADPPEVSKLKYEVKGDLAEKDRATLNISLKLGTPGGTTPKVYPVRPSFTPNANYDIKTVDGKYTVSKNMTFTSHGYSGEYDGTEHSIDVEREGDSSDYEVLFADRQFDSWADVQKYNQAQGYPAYGYTDAGNYTLYYYVLDDDTLISGSKNVIISPRQVTVTAADKSKTVGRDDPKLTYAVDNILDGDADKLSCDLVRAPGETIGSYVIRLGGELKSLGNNYEVSFHSGTIKPPAKAVKRLKKGKRSFTVSWKKAGKAEKKVIDGYQIRYSLKKNFKAAKAGSVKTKTVKKTAAKATVKKLKAGKTYYVQIRTFKKVGGVKYYSSWSKTRKVKTGK